MVHQRRDFGVRVYRNETAAELVAVADVTQDTMTFDNIL